MSVWEKAYDRAWGKPVQQIEVEGEGDGIVPVLILPARDRGEKGKMS
jgi:hypothetical protein